MSIRVRFTLVYSAILAATLFIFGIALFAIQARATYKTLQTDLLDASFGVSKIVDSRDGNALAVPHGDPNPRPFNEFFDKQQLRELPEREIVRLLDAEGNLIASPFGDSTDQLPFDTASLPALAAGSELWSKIELDGEQFLLLNHPVFSHDPVNPVLIGVAQVARSLSEREASLRSLHLIFIIASLVTVLFASAVGWWLSSYLLLPIQKMTKTAAEIREENDLSRRVEYKGPMDEVGLLARTFNQMLESVEKAYSRVEQSLQTQREFVADVSHELRTPLTTIRGNLGLLSRQGIAAEERAEIINDASEETKRLIRLVEALLDLARADTNRSLHIQKFDAVPVIDDTIRQTRVLDPDRVIRWESPAEAEVLDVEADRDAFKQALLVGLDNAIKHTKAGIDVQVEPLEQDILIHVIDHGAGMSAAEIENARQRFYRAHKQDYFGFGLGLPIASTLLTNMGGELTLTSTPGEGTRYTIRLPRAGKQTM